MNRIEEILNFWFGAPSELEYGQPRNNWFVKDSEFDQEIRTKFLADYEQARTGTLNHWQETPRGCLALILLLDQVPRNIFRGNKAAFATDEQALNIAQKAISQGYDKALIPVERWFMYLPLEHSENLTHQQQCVELFNQLKDHPASGYAIDFAWQHLRIIERFGRFPHRNIILGRQSTPEEIEFLKQENSAF